MAKKKPKSGAADKLINALLYDPIVPVEVEPDEHEYTVRVDVKFGVEVRGLKASSPFSAEGDACRLVRALLQARADALFLQTLVLDERYDLPEYDVIVEDKPMDVWLRTSYVAVDF